MDIPHRRVSFLSTRSLTKAGLSALLGTLLFSPLSSAQAVGTWTPVAREAPEPIGTLLLLTNGTVMGQGTFTTGPAAGNSDSHWFRLTPDAHGSYINGTWTPLASMNSPRTYYASTVLRNGRVLVAGGEYTDALDTNGNPAAVDSNAAEIYDPVADTWTQIVGPGWDHIGDAPVKTLFDGTVLLGSIFDPRTALCKQPSPKGDGFDATRRRVHQ